MSDLKRLTDELFVEEAVKLFPYTDSVGKLTIGVGRNLTDNGISREEALLLLSNDVGKVKAELSGDAVYSRLDDVRQNVLMDMAFNMGLPRLSGFKLMWAALAEGDYATAAAQMLNSTWAKQVGPRAQRLAEMMRTGQWPELPP